MKFIGFYNYTVILTYISLISGVLGMKFASEGKIGVAIGCLAFSGFCDLFDGAVARTKKDRTDDEKSFGIQLDSLCDVICFGAFPAVIMYFSGVNSAIGVAILVFYVLCALIRLAFFNVLETKRQSSESGCVKFYRGLPVTTSAIIFPFFYIVGLFLPDNVMGIIYYVLSLLTASLFIIDFRVPKLDVSRLFKKAKADCEQIEEEKTEKIEVNL